MLILRVDIEQIHFKYVKIAISNDNLKLFLIDTDFACNLSD